MPVRYEDDSSAKLTTLAVVAAVIAICYFASELILPIALATLLTFLLSPVATWIERRGLGRVPSVIAVTLLTFAIVVGIVWIVVSQSIALTAQLPKLRDGLIVRIEGLTEIAERSEAKPKSVEQPAGAERTADDDENAARTEGTNDESITATLNELAAQVTGEETDADGTPLVDGQRPIPVQIVSSGPAALEFLSDWLGPLLAPLGTAAIVLVFVVFMLLQRDDLRDRFIRLSGRGRLAATTQALDEAAHRVSRYLFMLLIINGTYGLVVWFGLCLIGLPNPFLWGLLATALRFIPYVGPWVAAAAPILLSLAVDSEGWRTPLMTVALFVVLELFSNNVMEPWLYGQSLGISVFGIMVMASFWTWLWGPIGLVLSMPLTVCLVVLGRYVPQLHWLNIMLSDAPPLDLRAKYYQRLLALDYHESSQIVGEALEQGSVEQLYTDILMPALSLAERDRHAGELVETQRQFAYQTIRETIEELGERARTPDEAADEGTNPRAVRVWCVPAEDDADEIAGTMLAQLLTAHGYTAEAVPADDVDSKLLEQIAENAIDAVIISAVAPGGVTHARRLCRRLRPEREHLVILVGLWNATGPLEQADARLKSAGADAVVTTLEQALRLLEPKSNPDSSPQSETLEPAAAAR